VRRPRSTVTTSLTSAGGCEDVKRPPSLQAWECWAGVVGGCSRDVGMELFTLSTILRGFVGNEEVVVLLRLLRNVDSDGFGA